MSDPAQPKREIPDGYAWIALALAGIAGAVDGIGYLLLAHLFTSHMSGNTVAFTIDIAAGDWAKAWRHFEPIVAFFCGVLFGLIMTDVMLRLRISRLFGIIAGVEVLMLVAFLLLARPPAQWMAALPAAAMGVQNALLRRVGRRTVRTTFITGMLATTAHQLTSAFAALFDGDPKASRRFRDFCFYAGIWLCFAGGGITGAFVDLSKGRIALLLPVSALALLVLYDAWRPLTASSATPS